MLELVNVAKSFAGTQVLQPTTLRLAPGETTVLIGPSGCGKSTLLRLMIGLIEPDQGQVLFDGTPLAPSNVMQMRRKIGYVIQDGGLFPHLSARDNVGALGPPSRLGKAAHERPRRGAGRPDPPAASGPRPLSGPAFRRPAAAAGDHAGLDARPGGDSARRADGRTRSARAVRPAGGSAKHLPVAEQDGRASSRTTWAKPASSATP